ncbi:lamin tail domain-containing protein [Candidatus Microgenomates bacterium]|nr:lamin tail domain-containing protein [Candidatus Microgenomates bacterium]
MKKIAHHTKKISSTGIGVKATIVAVASILLVFSTSQNELSKGQPKLENLPDSVHENPITIRGDNVKPESDVDIFVNKEKNSSTTANNEGEFSAAVTLEEGENIIQAIGIDENDKEKKSPIQKINYIIDPPALAIIEPQNNTSTTADEIIVKGTTEPQNEVVVEEQPVSPDLKGNFQATVPLAPGPNEINIVVDNGKKKTEEIIIVEKKEDEKKELPQESPPTPITPSPEPITEPVPEPVPEPTPNPSKIIISYVHYSNDPGTEYIELKNTGGIEEDISVWTISDTDQNIFLFSEYILGAGDTVRIKTDGGRFSFDTKESVWNRYGEPAYLTNREGRIIDVYSY